MLIVQSLGRMDEILRRTDERIAPYAARREDPPDIDITLHLTHSYLWVLGTYEITRTVDQHAHEDAALFPAEDAARINELKRKFARLRMPLAKLEPSHKHRDIDFSFPLPAFDARHGTAWAVSSDILVARRELADSFLEVFESIRHSKRGDAGRRRRLTSDPLGGLPIEHTLETSRVIFWRLRSSRHGAV